MKKYNNYRWMLYNYKKKVKNDWKPKQNGILTTQIYASHSYENKPYTNLGHLNQNIKSNKLTGE